MSVNSSDSCINQTFLPMNTINKEKVTDKLKAYIEQWENNSERMKSGYDYERTFVEMMRKFEKELFQESMGKMPGKNGKKNSKPVREK